jgi:dTDP-glucose 4,6-dehydratase
MNVLVTGGCGFIGSAFIRTVLAKRPSWRVTNLDALTYAGNPDNLASVENHRRYRFVKGSIVDPEAVAPLVAAADAVVNFAAESHVDRSLYGPSVFVSTNVQGTLTLIEAMRRKGRGRFLQVSTDEVYGSLPPSGTFHETTPLHPNNPYSATKAAADLLVASYVHTFGVDGRITRSSNNYGPFQHPEKFIPLFIANAMEDKPCPVYGDGMQIRDWLHVEDNARGVLLALERGRAGEVYNLGGGNERPNLRVAKAILRELGKPESLLVFVKDRPGHDRRYAIDCRKAKRDLGWTPEIRFEDGLAATIRWYREHSGWVDRARSGAYRDYYRGHYGTGHARALRRPARS